jgi:lysine decarboxylase
MDNLHAPKGMLKKLQERLAVIYGADESYLLINGSTAGILAAVCTVCDESKIITVNRNAHKSVFNALALSGAWPEYIQPDYFGDGLPGGIKPERLSGITGAVFITSPTYEGFVPDVKSIASTVHARGGILIVDEAHGAHFPFHGALPSHALLHGADVVINSLHKTLPMLSQTAVLHVRGPRLDRERLRFYLQAVQTTSPSYILMGHVDYVLDMLTAELFNDYIRDLMVLRKNLPEGGINVPISLSGIGRTGCRGVAATDPGKLLFNLNADINIDILRGYGIEPEMVTDRHLLAMTSPADKKMGFDRLLHAVHELNRNLPVRNLPVVTPPVLPQVCLSPRDAVRRVKETVTAAQSIGRIAGEMIMPYPPGVPLLAPGEIITEEMTDILPDYIKVI